MVRVNDIQRGIPNQQREEVNVGTLRGRRVRPIANQEQEPTLEFKHVFLVWLIAFLADTTMRFYRSYQLENDS